MNANLSMDFMGEYLAARKRAEDVFSFPLITKKHIKSLNGPEAEYLYKKIGDTYSGLEGDERARFTRKIRPLLAGDSNKEIWELNQSQITVAIKKLLSETGAMPTNSAIARETGLSRQTIINHFKQDIKHTGARPAWRILKPKRPDYWRNSTNAPSKATLKLPGVT